MSHRARALICSAVMLAVALTAISMAGAAGSQSGSHRLLIRCVRTILPGPGRGAATPVPGSGAAIAGRFSAFRRARTAADTIPASVHLATVLGDERVLTYDPSALVRLRRVGATTLFAVPATLGSVTVPSGCSRLPALAGVAAYVAAQADQRGSGPGACLVATQPMPRPQPGLSLPGARAPKPVQQLGILDVVCRSAPVIAGYVGAFGDGSPAGLALIPDGIGAITYTMPSGDRITVPVTGNLVRAPAAVMITPSPHPQTGAQLTAQLTSHLPTSITETGGPGQAAVTLPRPQALIPDTVGEFTFLRRLFSRSGVTASGSGASSSGDESVSCREQTHRCVAVLVTTTCNSHGRCRTTRSIHRYRYVGARPPRGTVGATTLPTAPVVGRADRFVRHPRRLSLVLSGTPQAHVGVIAIVSCFLHGGQAEGGGPPLTRTVPSRSRIVLPGRAGSFSACDIGVLVTSRRPGAVHVRIVRG
ncbi:MAG TPA: hypothetical protein VFN55_10025 [Solirubrobacteraceae bacterium]|nr:hypothetical protein [Solirubrobacteraceae bacterium]